MQCFVFGVVRSQECCVCLRFLILGKLAPCTPAAIHAQGLSTRDRVSVEHSWFPGMGGQRGKIYRFPPTPNLGASVYTLHSNIKFMLISRDVMNLGRWVNQRYSCALFTKGRGLFEVGVPPSVTVCAALCSVYIFNIKSLRGLPVES